MNPGVKFHETILRRIVLEPGRWSGGADYAVFRHAAPAFSFTEAYGRPAVRHACWCAGTVRSRFALSSVRDGPDRRSRYLLKITASWREAHTAVHPVRIAVNGSPVYDGPFFLENIVTGWPSQYFDLPPSVLKAGANDIEMSVKDPDRTLLLAGAEILRRPDDVDFSVVSSPDVAAVGEEFWVELRLLRDHAEIRAAAPRGRAVFLRRDGTLFRFRAAGPGRNVRLVFSSGSRRCEAVVGRIVPERRPDRVPFLSGMDGDDLRHDTTGEMERALETFVHARTGDYMGFRPGLGRNVCDALRPDQERWRRWIRFCRDRGVSMHFSGDPTLLGGLDIAAEAGGRFAGYQFHEPYLVFSSVSGRLFMTEKLAAARTPPEKRDAFLEYLRDRVRRERRGNAAVYSGEPSLTCVYTARSGVDAILCEPVSNIALLYGAARASGTVFGAHVPADWYFGRPHDESALRRVRLAVRMAYIHGARIVYVESSLFKTNAFDRNDWEDPFCRGVRSAMRDLHRFAAADERTGAQEVPLALAYGNLESMFWMDDDRIPEVADSGNWDRSHWGLPGAAPHRRVWRACEAWLPRVPLDDPRNDSLTRMFAGTPYGPVDVVAADAELSRYRAVAFLGWNTMTPTIYAGLLRFVEAGGTLVLCGCHLDTRTDPAAPPAILFGGAVADLVGAEIRGPGAHLGAGVRACALERVSARRAGERFLVHRRGSGTVWFGDFFDYPADPLFTGMLAAVLRTVGRNVRDAAPVRIAAGSPYINYTLWRDGTALKIYALDADWRSEDRPGSALTVRSAGRARTIPVRPGRLVAATIR